MSAEKATWRQQPRWECSIEATVVLADDEAGCVVTDISDGGARAWFAETDRLDVGEGVTLRLPDRGEVRASVRYVAGLVAGLAFVDEERAAHGYRIAVPRGADDGPQLTAVAR